MTDLITALGNQLKMNGYKRDEKKGLRGEIKL